MKALADIAVTSELRQRAQVIADQLGPVRVLAGPRWQRFADELQLSDVQRGTERLDNVMTPEVMTLEHVATVVVGAPADVLRHARTETSEFGFVMPCAHIARWWQRSSSWRDDSTLRLWVEGWSPQAVDRLLVGAPSGVVEFVIGSARRTPAVVTDGPSL